jgi:hypothetical protein
MSDGIEMSAEGLEALREAKRALLAPSLTAQLSDLIGGPIEAGLKRLPKNWGAKVGQATETALYKGLKFSLTTMGKGEAARSKDWLHKILVTGSGAAAGAVGFYSLIVELPFSTCVMLRSIADIARSQGHDLTLVDTRLACLEVFALGGGSSADAAETSYWAVRGALAAAITEAGKNILSKGVLDKSAPAIVRLIAQIASRFGVVVTAQAAAIAVPVVGAVSGGAVNFMFMNHFQDVARAHFAIKRLEKQYGAEVVRAVYDGLTV